MRHPLLVEDVLALAQQRGLSVPVWNWPRMKLYNGFSHEQRVRGWQAEKLAIHLGMLTDPRNLACDLCGGRERIGYHAEDYKGLVRFPLCQGCHAALHMRFQYPVSWSRRVRQYPQRQAWLDVLKS